MKLQAGAGPEAQQYIRVAVFLLGAIAVALVVSFLVPGLVRVLRETCESLRRLQARLNSTATAYFEQFLDRFWRRTTREPRATIAAGLNRLAQTVESTPAEEVSRLRDIERNLERDIASAKDLSLDLSLASSLSVDDLANALAKPRPGFGLPALLLVMLIAFGTTNSFLLNLYFRETLGPQRLLPYPLPDLQASHVLALLLAFMEVGAGMAIHFFDDEKDESGTIRFFRIVPWLAIFALMLIELLAYATLSARIDLPTRLGISSNSGFYGIVKYFLAALGAVITLLLASLGYMLWTSWHRWIAGRQELRAIATLRALPKAIDTMAAKLARAADRLAQVRKAVEDFPTALVSTFQTVQGTHLQRATVTEAIRDALSALFANHQQSLEEAGPTLRTKAQVLADIALGVVVALVWTAVLLLFVDNVQTYLSTLAPSQVVSYGTAWVSAIAVALFGYMTKDTLAQSRYATIVAAATPLSKGRRVLRVFVTAGFLIGTAISVGVSVSSHPLGTSTLINALFGAFLALALASLSFLIDSAIVALLLATQAIYYMFALALARLVVFGLILLDGILFALQQLLKFLAVPGDWLRSWARPRSIQ